MNANLHHLELFYYVAKSKGISSALKVIPYSIQQPAISQQLMKLEESLGVKLFERKPFSLTPAGENLYRFLARFFSNLDSELLGLKEQNGFRMRFGCPSVISSKYLPALIRCMLRDFPQMQPRIQEIEGLRGIPELAARQIDVLITFSAPPKSKSMCVNDIAKMPMCLIVPEKHRFAQKGFWAKADFAREHWIALQETSGGTQELIHGLSAFGVSPVFSVSTNSIEACLDYVSMGLGIALMAMPPANLILGRGLTIIPADEYFGSVSLSIVWMNDCLIEDNVLNHLVRTARDMTRGLLDAGHAEA